MPQDSRMSIGLFVSFVIAVVVAFGLTYLREETSRRPKPVTMPVAEAHSLTDK